MMKSRHSIARLIQSGGVRLAIAVGLLVVAPAAASGPRRLRVVEQTLHQYEDGPPVSSSFEFFPGDVVFLSFKIAGYQLTEENALRLSYRIVALDPEGIRLVKPKAEEIATSLTRQDKKKKWMPIVRYDVAVPQSAPSGKYRIAITVTDELAKTAAESVAVFTVRGAGVEPSKTLVIRNFHFYRSETAAEALPKASYRPGDSIWARFDITGYQFGENNRFSIEYGIQVFRASGKLLFEQPVAAAVEQESYYPRRHIPGALSLNLTPDIAKGPYTVIVTVKDRIGEQVCQTKQVFTVE